MYNPNDDPDVISGLCDDAKKEMATTPGTSQGSTALSVIQEESIRGAGAALRMIDIMTGVFLTVRKAALCQESALHLK